MHVVKMYHCSFCKKVLSKRSDMEKHEARCPHNPESHSCITCAKFIDPRYSNQDVPGCELGLLDKDCKHPRNPHGLRRDCDFYDVNPYTPHVI